MEQTYTNIALLDHLGQGNLGDDATLDAVMHNIKSRWPHSRIIGLSLNPIDTKKRHGITSYAIRRDCRLPPSTAADNTKATPVARLRTTIRKYPLLHRLVRFITAPIWLPWKALQECRFLLDSFCIMNSLDLLVICGGGQLRDPWHGPWNFPGTLFKWALLARLSNVRCYFLNVGAGPLTTRWTRFLIRRSLYFADYISFRDQDSQSLIRQIGFKGDSVVHADNVYALPFAPGNAARRSSRDLIIGISPMKVPWKTDAAYRRNIEQLAQFAVHLLSQHYRLSLFGTEISSDCYAVADLYAAIKQRLDPSLLDRVTCPPIDGVEALFSVLSGLDYIVTFRFHGVVFAHLMNIPLLAISHHRKVTALMSDIGLVEYCLNLDTFEASQLAHAFGSLVKHTGAVKLRMARRAAEYSDDLASQYNSLFASAYP